MSTARSASDHATQDGGMASKSAREKYRVAAQKLFSLNGMWDLLELPADGAEDHSGTLLDADETMPLEDSMAPVLPWDTISTTPIFQSLQTATSTGLAGPQPTLRDIFSAVTSSNLSITALAMEVKGMKAEMSFLRQDMQKLRDCTSTIEGSINTIEDDWAPMQRESHAQQPIVVKRATNLDLEN